jgi:hypothetical protein
VRPEYEAGQLRAATPNGIAIGYKQTQQLSVQ